MYTVDAQNVNDAYSKGMNMLRHVGELETSRAGDVLVAPMPVTTIYQRPTQRVLFDPGRDANPFFHLMESVWMLAGRRDATWLDLYVKDFSARFAEDDGNIWGAYGHRWRRHFSGPTHDTVSDQIVHVGNMLAKDFTTRRAVMAMWDPVSDLGASKKDMPCNTHVFFRGRVNNDRPVLDVTVCNRSNDIIWGAYGANVVHMSVMAEVVAGLAGAFLGRYYQISNNYHAYVDIFDKMSMQKHDYQDPYRDGVVELPIVTGYSTEERRESAKGVLSDAGMFCAFRDTRQPTDYESTWFRNVVVPMESAHSAYRAGDPIDALQRCVKIRSLDWQRAASEWLQRRIAAKEARS